MIGHMIGLKLKTNLIELKPNRLNLRTNRIGLNITGNTIGHDREFYLEWDVLTSSLIGMYNLFSA